MKHHYASILNEMQSQILLEVLSSKRGSLTCREILNQCKTGQSTLIKERKALETSGLIKCDFRVEFGDDNEVVRHMIVSLTPKGRLVARLLLDASNTVALNYAA